MVTFYRRLPRFEYLAPKTVDEVLSLLSRHTKRAKVIAGGTDILPKLKRREIKAPEYIIDLKGVPNLDYISYDESSGLRIGALTTIQAVETSPIIREKFGVLHQAAVNMASTQVRNRGTVVGNICNASPSADTVPPLLTLEAKLKLVSQKGERIVNIENFFTGPGGTILTDEELLFEIQVPNLPRYSKSRYLKLTPRRSMDLAIVGVAVVVILENGICSDMRVALGAVAPTPVTVKGVKDIIKSRRFSEDVIEKVAQVASGQSRPIDDMRGSAEYRKEMVKALVSRAINQVISN